MGQPLDRNTLHAAFQRLGERLAACGAFVELAVHGGRAMMLQFAWRLSTEDVDAVVREGYEDAVLARSVIDVAHQMSLDPDWLNNAVGMVTPLREDETLFQLAGSYPDTARPGLRVLLARPHDRLAMKLKALDALDRGDRDLTGARALAQHLGVADEDELCRLYGAIHDERPPQEARIRFRAVLGP